MHQGDDILWYLVARLSAAAGARLQAPARATADVPVPGDGSRLRATTAPARPAAGVTVTGAASPDRRRRAHDGDASPTGTDLLRATRAPDHPVEPGRGLREGRPVECPTAHGQRIVGSDAGDQIDGTRGWDSIRPGVAADVINITARRPRPGWLRRRRATR